MCHKKLNQRLSVIPSVLNKHKQGPVVTGYTVALPSPQRHPVLCPSIILNCGGKVIAPLGQILQSSICPRQEKKKKKKRMPTAKSILIARGGLKKLHTWCCPNLRNEINIHVDRLYFTEV